MTMSKNSKSVCIILPQKCYDDFKKIIFMKQTSINQIGSQLIKQFVADNQQFVEAYNKVFPNHQD